MCSMSSFDGCERQKSCLLSVSMCCCNSERQKSFMDVRKVLNFTTNSVKKLKNSDGHNLQDSKDIISSLVDDILLLILSFLDIKVAVQTSILSTRWRYLLSSLRVLNFDQRLYPCYKKYPFTNSLDKVITVLGTVQEVHLKLSSEPPHCLFTCKSIRILKLKGVDGFLWLRNPHSVNLPALKALHLTRVVFNKNLVNDFLSSCPGLEDLSIKCCEFIHIESLNISSPQLKKLVIIAYHKNYGCMKNYEIKISAPKLTFFKCRDYMTKIYSLDNISALVSADIDLKINEHSVPLGTKEEYVQRVIKFLKGLCHAESLSLSASSVEMFSSALEKIKCLPTQISTVRHFKLTASPNDACAQVVQLLKNLPNIKTLLIEITWTDFKSYQGRLYWDEPPFYSTIMELNWESRLQFHGMLYHLKSVEIRNFLGCENEINLLKVLLKKSIILEKIKIVLAQVWPHSREKMMWIVWMILQRVPRASLDVTLEFVNFFSVKL